MKAPSRAKQVHAQKSKDGTLTQGVVVPFRTAAEKAQKFLGWKDSQKPRAKPREPSPPAWGEATPDVTNQVRLSRARMAAQGLPASGGYHTPKQDAGEPTPQRRAKGLRAPLQPYAGKWPPEVEVAFARFLIESDILSKAEQRVTINYDSTGGSGNPATRAGGYGNQSDRLATLHQRYKFVRANLKWRQRYVLDKILLEMPIEATGKVMTLAEMGRFIFPHIRDIASSKCITLGYLVGIGESLDDLYGYWEREIGGR